MFHCERIFEFVRASTAIRWETLLNVWIVLSVLNMFDEVPYRPLGKTFCFSDMNVLDEDGCASFLVARKMCF